MKQYGLPFIPPHELSGLAADTPLLLGFSGGADSRALLDLLVRYRESTGAPLFAAHVNHMIRGDEAVRDMRFACETAAAAGVHCFTLCADVPALAKQRGQGLELTARQVRYEFFGRIMAENGIPVLVTAHNADDRLETLLFNIARGCGLGGLCAIPPRRPFGDGVLIRPLINAPKADIVAYCRERGLAFVTDSTNADDDYSRNLIRHKVIPPLSEVNPALLRNAGRLAAAARRDLDFIMEQVDRYFAENGEAACELARLRAQHPAVRARVLDEMYRRAAERLANEQPPSGQPGEECSALDTSAERSPDTRLVSAQLTEGHPAPEYRMPEPASDPARLEAVHAQALEQLIERGVGGSAVSLPGLVRASIVRGRLIFARDPRKSFRHL